jgi:hypothetical protein
LEDLLLEEQFNNLLPGLIYETGIDLWILISREPYIKNHASWYMLQHGKRKKNQASRKRFPLFEWPPDGITAYPQAEGTSWELIFLL